MKRLPESVKHRVVQLFHTCSFLQQLHLFGYIFFKQETWKGYWWTFSPAGNLLNKFTLGFGRWKVGERSLSMNKSFYDRQHNQPTHLFHRRPLFLTLNFLMNVDFQQEWEWQPKYWDLIPFTQFSIPTSWAADLLTNWLIIDSTSLHPQCSSWFIGLSKLI